MAFSTFTISSPASTGSATHAHGLGEVPKALIVIGNTLTSDGSGADAIIWIGFGDNSGNASGCGNFSDDALTSSDTQSFQGMTTERFIFATDSTGTTLIEATLTSVDSTNVTLDWTTVISGADFQCLAIGGSGISAEAGSFTTSTGTPPYDQVVSVGVNPDIVFLACTESVASSSTGQNAVFSFGAGDGSSQFVIESFDRDNRPTTETHTTYLTDKILYTVSGAGASRLNASLKSVGTGQFTLTHNYSEAIGVAYLVIQGVDVAFANYAQPNATTGNDTITLTGITPEALIIASSGRTSTGERDLSADFHVSLGLGVSSSSRGAFWSGSADASADSVCSQNQDSTKIIKHLVAGGGSPTLSSAADLVSFASGSATVNWTTADATQRLHGVIGISETVAGAGNPWYHYAQQ